MDRDQAIKLMQDLLRRVTEKKASDLFKVLDAHKVGDEVDLTLENDGHRRTTKVSLQALP